MSVGLERAPSGAVPSLTESSSFNFSQRLLLNSSASSAPSEGLPLVVVVGGTVEPAGIDVSSDFGTDGSVGAAGASGTVRGAEIEPYAESPPPILNQMAG